MDEQRREAMKQLQTASPLEIPKILQELELYDQKSSQEIIDEVYAQFESGENLKDEVLNPVFESVVDGLLQATSFGRAAMKKGITASRVVNECKSFSYDGEQDFQTNVDGYTEYKNARYSEIEYQIALNQWEKNPVGPKPEYNGIVNSDMTQAYNKDIRKKKYEDKRAMDGYKDRNTIGHNKVKDEYNGGDLERHQSVGSNGIDYSKSSETDHIVPLKQIHDEFKHNYALDDNDIKLIANADYNFAMTSSETNRSKRALTNKEYIEKMKQQGTPVDAETEQRMLQLQKEAETAIDKQANSLVVHNLIGKPDQQAIDTKYDALLKSKIEAYELKHGTKPTGDKLKNIEDRVAREKQSEMEEYVQRQKEKSREITGNAVKNAAEQAKDYAVGNLILFIVKPVYYELSDSFKNGLEAGVGASSGVEALIIRFGRVKDYVLSHAGSFFGDNLLEFVKGFVSSLVEGIIGLFVGIFKQILKVIKEGVKVFVRSAKVLFGRDAQKMSAAEKGDAIIKILGGGVVAIAGVALESLLNKIGIGEPWSIVISTMLSGIASALFMYLLEKVDLFNVKANKRHDRIVEIFNERINDIEEAVQTCKSDTIDALKHQREQFEEVCAKVDEGIKTNNIELILGNLYGIAEVMHVDLPYSNSKDFCDYMDEQESLAF